MKKFFISFLAGVGATLLAVIALYKRRQTPLVKSQEILKLEERHEHDKQKVDSILPERPPKDIESIQRELRARGDLK